MTHKTQVKIVFNEEQSQTLKRLLQTQERLFLKYIKAFFHKDKMVLSALDDATVAGTTAELYKGFFKKYSAKKELVTYEINIPHFLKALENLPRKAILTLEFQADKEEDQLIQIRIDKPSSKEDDKILVPVLEQTLVSKENTNKPVEQTVYTNLIDKSVKMCFKKDELYSAIKRVYHKDYGSVRFFYDKKKDLLQLTAGFSNNDVASVKIVSYAHPTLSLFPEKMKVKEEFRAIYSQEYINNFFHRTKGLAAFAKSTDSALAAYFSNDHPLIFEVEQPEKFNFKIILAPRMDNDW